MGALKLRQKVNFPATVTAVGGLGIDKVSGRWTVSPQWGDLSLITTLPSPATKEVWARDPATNSYYRITVQAFIDSLPEGPPGAAATIAAGTTATGNAGSSASVTNSGTSNAAVFDFITPRGADSGLRYAFDTSTSMAAPAAGGVRLNSATLASVTAMAVNAAEAGGVDVSDFIATWDDSTNTTKGYVEIRKEGSGAVLALYKVTSVTDNTTWLQLALTYISGSGSFAASDPVYLVPYIVGNAGTNGAVAVSGTPTVNQFGAWVDATTLKGVSITGLVKGNGASAPTAAIAGTDYVSATSGSAVQKANGSGGLTAATAGTDYQAPIGTISGVAKGNGANALTAATAGTDYVAPGTATAFTKQQSFTLATLTDGATINWDVSGAQKAKVTLGGSRTIAAVTNAVEGTTYLLWVIQDATGSRTLTWTTTGAGSFDFGAAGAPVLSTGANKADLLCFESVVISSTLRLVFAGMRPGN